MFALPNVLTIVNDVHTTGSQLQPQTARPTRVLDTISK